MKSASRTHDYVLVDCPGAASSMLDAAIRESQIVVAPCQPSVMDVWATRSVLDTAAKQKTPVHILLNRMPPRIGTLEDILAALGDDRDKVLETTLGNRVAFSQSVLTGRTASELNRRSTAARETEALRAEIEKLLSAA
jgi:chromosome partitioning protein